MILETVVGLSLIIHASLDSRSPSPSELGAETQLSVRQKSLALLPLIRRATECIARKVHSDPRYADDLRPGQVSDLIVDSMQTCVRPLRAMINAHDLFYGRGTGEAFMLGPYLDVLPAAVVRHAKERTHAR